MKTLEQELRDLLQTFDQKWAGPGHVNTISSSSLKAWNNFLRIHRKNPLLGNLLAEQLLQIPLTQKARQYAAIVGLTWHSGPAARSFLEKLLLSDDLELNREDIVEAIHRIGDPLSFPALIKALGIEDITDGLHPKIVHALVDIDKDKTKAFFQSFVTDNTYLAWTIEESLKEE